MVVLALGIVAALAGIGEAHRTELRDALAPHVADPARVDALVARAEAAAARLEEQLGRVGDPAGVGDRYAEHVVASLREKEARGLLLDEDTAGRTVIDFEAFRLGAYVTSGVFPKRYFGYFDARSDTAALEVAVMRTTRACVRAIDAWQAEHGRPVRLTEAEVAVTFYAEGGALWLDDGRPLHPVVDVGLDDLASGVADSAGVIAAIDRAAGTGLGELVAWVDAGATELPVPSSVPSRERWLQHGNGDRGPFPYLVRKMTLEEAVAGTALMVLWEKERADRLLRKGGHAPIAGRPLDEQFVVMSLVYNSGLLHTPTRWRQILAFSTGQTLYERSERNAARRPRLNLLRPPDQLRELVATGKYREQPTSWVAVYHVLQRYGAFAALRRFTDRFDAAGAFTEIPALPAPPAPVPPPATEEAPAPPASPAGCGCGTGPGLGSAGIAALAASALAGRRRAAGGRRRSDR